MLAKVLGSCSTERRRVSGPDAYGTLTRKFLPRHFFVPRGRNGSANWHIAQKRAQEHVNVYRVIRAEFRPILSLARIAASCGTEVLRCFIRAIFRGNGPAE